MPEFNRKGLFCDIHNNHTSRMLKYKIYNLIKIWKQRNKCLIDGILCYSLNRWQGAAFPR